ncbi:D-amino-acid dehydrogenase [Neisseria sp. HSC-16F19]|nr:FAD-dependent oxidoreductase [Neisseria sp. HSC-16F19]MCP2040382.1 D-amino-acid dehydrogenase [Neisseria sp. HSC-16F19]
MSSGHRQPELYVVGGGIIGLCSALELQSHGVRVAIVEAETICGGASYGNAGHIACEQVFPIAEPAILAQLPSMLTNPLGPLRLDWQYLPRLMPWALKLLWSMRPQAAAHIHRALKQINDASLAAWQDFARRWQLQPWLHVQGSLLTAERAESVAKLAAHGERLNDLGVPNRLLKQQALQEREPLLADTQQAALFFPETGHISDLPRIARQLRQHFTDLGGTVREHCPVTHITPGSGHVVLHTPQGGITAPKVLISAGAFSKQLAAQATGVRVPLDTERGYHLMLPHELQRLSVPVTSMERRFIMTPMASGLRLAGTVEFAGLDKPAHMARAQQLLKLAQPMFKTALDSRDAAPWMGFRPSTADSLPVIDRQQHVFLNFGHQHLGLTQAVVSAQITAALYFERPAGLDIRPYRLARFA